MHEEIIYSYSCKRLCIEGLTFVQAYSYNFVAILLCVFHCLVSLHHGSLVKILTNGYWMHIKRTSLNGYPVAHLVQ